MDYKKLGFKCGIELHQQLETHKLFCKCPSIVHDKNPDIFFERKLRAVAGETGKVDKAAAFEMSKGKTIKYEACSTSSCLVELDEEPPREVNEEALRIAFEIALLLNTKPVDSVQFMRKTVVDGSNVSGFQRTALIGTDGYVETSKGKVGIWGVFLEEEAAKKVKTENNITTYRLDRLGVPLVEIATAPDIKDAEHAKETANLIGMILRSTGKVKRGIGTVRQDVNVSIKGKSRVEIKGFQEVRIMPTTIENEVKRQIKLKESKPEVRGFNIDGTTKFLRPMPGGARMYPETDVPTTPITKSFLKSIKLPELISKRVLKLEKKYNLPTPIAKDIISEGIKLDPFIDEFPKLEPKFLANVLINYPREIKSRFKLKTDKLTYHDFRKVFTFLSERKISKEAVLDLLVGAAQGKPMDPSKFETVCNNDLKKELKKIVDANPGVPIGGLMGDAMKKFRGKVDGKKIMAILKELA